MLKKSSILSWNSLIDISRYSIVYRHLRLRSPFDRTQYIENYVERQSKFHKSRKPPLPQWTDPNVIWPLILPSPTKLTGKSLIRSLEAKEKEKIRALKTFSYPDFRTGDVIEVTYMHSVSEGKTNTIQGLCTGLFKKNSLEGSFEIVFRAAGCLVKSKMQMNTPMIIDFKLLKKGSGCLNSKVGNRIFSRDMEQSQLLKPLKKKSKMKRRREDSFRFNSKSVKKDKLEKSFDEILS